MHAHALLINADYAPIKLISWKRAMILLIEEKADLVAGYATEAVRTVTASFEKPAVVRLREYVQTRGRVRFNRQNVLARDGYTCAYCGASPRQGRKPDIGALTLDHVVPRAHARGERVFLPWSKRSVPVTCWENVVAACEPCNIRKADRTPEQAGMHLARYPRSPNARDVLRMALTRVEIPDEWRDYLPEDSEWRGYWTEPLDES